MSESTPSPEQRSANSTSARAGSSGAKRRVALLGAGYIADWHAMALQSVAGVEVVAVCDRVQEKAHALARKFGVTGVYESLDAMLAAEKASPGGLDAVHILTPPDRHFDAARAALEAGVHVFLEKPMCATADDCDALVRLAEERGLRLGVGHNFLFAENYEQLRRDVKSGILGLIDDVAITWHRPLPQAMHGPFDAWMLRDPRNILIEVGSHSVAHLLDLMGEPDEFDARPSRATELPTGVKFYRHWQVNALRGRTAIELRFSFVPGFSEYSIHVRGSLASATVDFERNTYTLDEHRPSGPDFENYGIVVDRAKSLKRQSRHTLAAYIEAKLKMGKRGNPYGASIARAMDAFYSASPLDERVSGRMGARVIRLCEKLGAQAHLPEEKEGPGSVAISSSATARILVLGGTGFIGKELLRQLIEEGHTVRVLVRSLAGIPSELRVAGKLEYVAGDIANRQDLLRAMEGIEIVFHLARANVKSRDDYQALEIEATRRVGECALASGVKRMLYTGTVDSYYCGAGAGTITEETPLDPRIERRSCCGCIVSRGCR
jgi:predicted dehydrogenase